VTSSRERIRFYSNREEPYGCFSNFSHHGFELDGASWPTSEHYFQAQKFAGREYAERIRRAPNPMEAARLGRVRDVPLRPDWDQVKNESMRRAVWQKFKTHPELQAVLLATGDAEIIEAAPNDAYWGAGADGRGRNELGKILMEVRDKLRAEASSRT